MRPDASFVEGHDAASSLDAGHDDLSAPHRRGSAAKLRAVQLADTGEDTMSVKLYAMTCGHVTGSFGRLMEGGEGDVTVPIPAYLIEHPKGTALFDTGMHPDCQVDPEKRAGSRIAQLFRFDYRKGEEVSARLEAIGRDPRKIDLIVNSHLHFDHVGGNECIPNATVVVQKREWDAGQDPEMAAARGFNRRDYDLGHKIRIVDGEHDLFGDGSVMLLPTHGHTPGHQSVKVRLATGDVVLAADSCYFCRTLRERLLPTAVYDREQMLQSLDKLARLEDAGARLFFGHDPELWKTVPQAPRPIT
jgi:N-acyl homoserine lactone hydrolase